MAEATTAPTAPTNAPAPAARPSVPANSNPAPATTEQPASNGSASVKKEPRTDRLVVGYSAGLNDLRKYARAKFGAGTTGCNVVYSLCDELEELKLEDGKSIETICKDARADRVASAESAS